MKIGKTNSQYVEKKLNKVTKTFKETFAGKRA